MAHGNGDMNMRLFILVLIMLGLFAPELAAQQVGKRHGPQFTFLHSSARGAGMADATTAVVEDFSGFGSNPANLGLMQRSIVDYSTQRVSKGITFEHVGIAYKITRNEGIAFSFEILHYGGTDFYTNDAVRNLGYEARTGLTYGMVMAEGLSVGISLQGITSTTGINNVWSFAGDIGFVYAPGKYIRYALTLKNLGADYEVPSPILRTDQYGKALMKVLAVGLAFDYPFDDRRKRLLVSLQNDKVLGQESLIYRLGVEYTPFYDKELQPSIRGGFVIRGLEVEPRFGLSVSFNRFSLDYGYRYSKRDGQPSQAFTFAYSW